MAKKILRTLAIVVVLGVIIAGVVFIARPRAIQRGVTVADLSVVHPGVNVNEGERRGLVRIAPGQRVETDAQGRARIRLDDGTVVLIDRSTKISVDDAKISLESGRLFVEGVVGARAEISVGDVKVRPGAARVGFDRREGPARVYAANDEIVVSAGNGEHKVRAGESALIEGANVSVRPEKAFDDWTGGLAAPWGAAGPPRRAVGEIWGAESRFEARRPGFAAHHSCVGREREARARDRRDPGHHHLFQRREQRRSRRLPHGAAAGRHRLAFCLGS